MTISNLVEKENEFISEKVLFSTGSANRGRSLKQVGPLPGQKSIRLAKKAVVPFPRCGLPPFPPGVPLAAASLCGDKEEGAEKTSPGPFWLRRLLSYPGNKKTGLSDQLIWG
jgi:hypothetical protein